MKKVQHITFNEDNLPVFAGDSFAVVGDWHGNLGWSIKALEGILSEGVKTIVHTGDFGFWEVNNKFLSRINNMLVQNNAVIVWVDGNHENHNLLDSLPISEELGGFRPVASNIWHAPRGLHWKFGDVLWMGVGGASSVDREYRVEGRDWFPQEVISTEDVEYASRDTDVSVIVSHDAPWMTPTLRMRYARPSHWSSSAIADSNVNQQKLQSIVDNVFPDVLFHGHHHLAYTDKIENPNIPGHETKIIGLDCDESTQQKNIMYVDCSGNQIWSF